MCGISGIYYRNGDDIDREELLTVRDEMVARGPDAAGHWFSPDGKVALGHRRLSIMDPSSKSSQPMMFADGRYYIVFNGEIYNHRDLRKDLEAKGVSFQTSGDTEVLLALFADQGEQMLHLLRGMFAFAIWDSITRKVFMARDPFGIKPLYYSEHKSKVYWSSQVKPLKAVIQTTPNPAGHVGFFLLGSVPEPHTLYKEIKSLPAGHCMWVDDSGLRMYRYCSITSMLSSRPKNVSRSQKEIIDEAKHVIEDSIRAHLVSDVPIGVFLSAGLDSTTILSIATANTSLMESITLGFNEYRNTINDETRLASSAASHYGTNHYEHFMDQREFESEYQNLLNAMDQPSIDGVNTYFVCKAVRRAGLKVALSGLGADELFSSYPSFKDIPNLVKYNRPLSKLPYIGKSFRVVSQPIISRFTSPKYSSIFEYGSTYGGAYFLRRGLFMPWELTDILDPDLVKEGWRDLNLLKCLEETYNQQCDPVGKIRALEMSWYMRNQLLRDSDWAGMAHSVEIRVPFIDVKLLERLSQILPLLNGIPKRDILGKIANNLPEDFYNRPKTGFSTPISSWLSNENKKLKHNRGHRGWAQSLYKHGGWSI